MKKLLITLLTLLTAGFISCNHTDEPITPGQDPPQIQGAVRPVGRSLGMAFTQLIGPAGGSLQSPDGTLTLTVPAGALTASTEVGIEPITSTCLGSIGHGWRLTPHGETFAKPVEIILNYSYLKDSITLPEALGLAYQDEKGIWRFMGASTMNKTAHTLTLLTTHFSDWALLHWMTLSPVAGRLHEKEQVTLKAIRYIALADKEDEFLIPIAPSYEDGYPVGEPQPLPQKYIKKWSLSGPGKLTPSGNGKEAVYIAPDNIPTTEIAAVSLSLQGFSGQAFLVSNLTLLGKEPIIDYLLVNERDGFGGKQSMLTIYGSNFGVQGNSSKITINGAPMEEISLWGDNIIVCAIPLIGPNSTGQLQVVAAGGATSKPHLLNEWNVVMEINRPCARIEQTLYHKGKIHLRIRGDASVPPQELTIIGKDHQRTANLLSYVHWEAGGKGASVLNNEEACGIEQEEWTYTEGRIPLTYQANTGDASYFEVALYLLPGKGFEVRLDYKATETVPSKFVFTSCDNNVQSNNRPFTVSFPTEFHEEWFPLLFDVDGSTLKEGSSVTHRVGIGSMNLHTNGSDPSYQHDIKLIWSKTPARY